MRTAPYRESGGLAGMERGRRVGVTLVLAVLVLLTLPAIVADTRVSRELSTVPTAFDHFLSLVDAATAANARVLVVDGPMDPRHHMFVRSKYGLYPREAILYPVSDDFTRVVLPADWRHLLRAARVARAQYILIWALPPAPRGQVAQDWWGWALPSTPQGAFPAAPARVRDGWGTLARVTP